MLLSYLKLAWKVLVDNALFRRFKSDADRRKSDDTRDLNYQQVRQIEIRFASPEEIELDGDHMGEISRVRVSVEHGGLNVMMPEGGEPSD